MIVKELCIPKLIVDLLLDMYGNYGNLILILVLQKALSYAKEPFFSIYINSIKPYMEKLRSLNFGSKLFTKLLTLYPALNTGNFVQTPQVEAKRGKKNEQLSQNKKTSKMTINSYNTGKSVQNSFGMHHRDKY
jgi:hypothetical protein